GRGHPRPRQEGVGRRRLGRGGPGRRGRRRAGARRQGHRHLRLGVGEQDDQGLLRQRQGEQQAEGGVLAARRSPPAAGKQGAEGRGGGRAAGMRGAFLEDLSSFQVAGLMLVVVGTAIWAWYTWRRK